MLSIIILLSVGFVIGMGIRGGSADLRKSLLIPILAALAAVGVSSLLKAFHFGADDRYLWAADLDGFYLGYGNEKGVERVRIDKDGRLVYSDSGKAIPEGARYYGEHPPHDNEPDPYQQRDW